MTNIELTYLDAKNQVTNQELSEMMSRNQGFLDEALKQITEKRGGSQLDATDDVLGWLNVDEWASQEAVDQIMKMADEVRKNADVFVLIGVGGSNQAARAVIKAFQSSDGPEILYAGNNISPHYVNRLIEKLEGKSVYINVIAKNFETLEPGIGFRVLRRYLHGRYGETANQRITVTGTKGSWFQQIAIDHGYDFLVFPDNIGGRFSVLSDVGLFPMAVAGIDITRVVAGAKEMQHRLMNESLEDHLALKYACYRNLLLYKGFQIEMLAFFEPQFEYFSKWWVQLFAESEGKDGKGIFPVSASFSEDLHSVGQYIQEGQRILFETFIDIQKQTNSLVLFDDQVEDRFGYLHEKDFWEINKAASEATITAHSESGIPCLKLMVPEINEYYFGQLFYFFEFSCYLSARILGVNPFNQPGVENYKNYMFRKLGKNF